MWVVIARAKFDTYMQLHMPAISGSYMCASLLKHNKFDIYRYL